MDDAIDDVGTDNMDDIAHTESMDDVDAMVEMDAMDDFEILMIRMRCVMARILTRWVILPMCVQWMFWLARMKWVM